MRVVEGPFVTRQAIVSVVALGAPTTEAPFRTLRRHDAVSPGVAIPLRTTSGQFLGRMHLYSALSADAARLFRTGHRDAATRMAKRAARLERSPFGRRVFDAVADLAGQLPTDPRGDDQTAPEAQLLRAYVDQRRRSSWDALDQAGLWRSWLSEPQTWLRGESDHAVRDAIEALAERASDARSKEADLAPLGLTTLIGIVERLDPTAAELSTPDGSRFIVPRRDLEREGLAIVGQAVTVIREELAGGRVLDSYAAAARLDPGRAFEDFDPFASPLVQALDRPDSTWLERVLSSEPTTLPAAPILLDRR